MAGFGYENFCMCSKVNWFLGGQRSILMGSIFASWKKDFNDAMMPQYSVRDFSAEVRAGRNAWS